jgi:hypothetical protein
MFKFMAIALILATSVNAFRLSPRPVTAVRPAATRLHAIDASSLYTAVEVVTKDDGER